MHLIVGLGNPGKKYLFTRHNIGFMAIDVYRQAFEVSEKNEQDALTYKVKVKGNDVLLVKPQTFMNLSGQSVRGLMAFYKIPVENILVIHDEVDLPYGTIKIHKGSSAGHNGIKSIHELLGREDYARLRLGVGRPFDSRQAVPDYVLQNFSDGEQSFLEDYMLRACDAIDSFILDGFDKAASLHNKKVDYRSGDTKEE